MSLSTVVLFLAPAVMGRRLYAIAAEAHTAPAACAVFADIVKIVNAVRVLAAPEPGRVAFGKETAERFDNRYD